MVFHFLVGLNLLALATAKAAAKETGKKLLSLHPKVMSSFR